MTLWESLGWLALSADSASTCMTLSNTSQLHVHGRCCSHSQSCRSSQQAKMHTSHESFRGYWLSQEGSAQEHSKQGWRHGVCFESDVLTSPTVTAIEPSVESGITPCRQLGLDMMSDLRQTDPKQMLAVMTGSTENDSQQGWREGWHRVCPVHQAQGGTHE